MTEIPIAPVMRMIKNTSNVRVSKDAGIELTKILESIGTEISKDAVMLAKHAGRKTVKSLDILLAYENY
ncbi:histone family protein [Methanosphaera cuniculi]|uniref:Histone n=1 Tax=Methanosphaera cuniculi TaxID=1077256 RepID=A0A2A2HDW7_9EURY|nr:histone family protein [Methanosphaera cuniculi]PAV07629.1 histone [Methanosphaera cuniculi]PWL08047.1 histone-like transcription factor (CBF/NF-Y) and archaeal histone [Methanosphaera cuniculi]